MATSAILGKEYAAALRVSIERECPLRGLIYCLLLYCVPDDMRGYPYRISAAVR